jgi:hypothetical protein
MKPAPVFAIGPRLTRMAGKCDMKSRRTDSYQHGVKMADRIRNGGGDWNEPENPQDARMQRIEQLEAKVLALERRKIQIETIAEKVLEAMEIKE